MFTFDASVLIAHIGTRNKEQLDELEIELGDDMFPVLRPVSDDKNESQILVKPSIDFVVSTLKAASRILDAVGRERFCDIRSQPGHHKQCFFFYYSSDDWWRGGNSARRMAHAHRGPAQVSGKKGPKDRKR